GGWLVDRIGPRTMYACACGLWSLATLAQGFCATFLALLGLRLLLGVFEAPAFPICNRLVTAWFPENERAGAIGFYTAGQYAGLAFLTPLLVIAQRHLGWRSVFLLTGAVGLAWAAFWYLVYRDPADCRRLSAAERDHIRAGGGWVDGQPPRARRFALDPSDLRFVLTQRRLWGMYLGQFALNAVPWFFLTWFPTYLVTYRHFDFIREGIFTSLPFLAAVCGVVSGGLFSDLLVRRGVSASVARKAPVIAGMILSASVVGANYVSDPRAVMLFLTVAFFGNGFASITWVLVSLMAPRRLLGLTGGVFNFIGNLAAMIVPLVIGIIVKYGGFAPALAFVAALTLGGALSYILLVGRVERIAPGGD
ncbi:MAG TPA: MFS transporter, partial [Opitutaceae bacterium]|nr:MFS transporter [Opitutaceae bacterium]